MKYLWPIIVVWILAGLTWLLGWKMDIDAANFTSELTLADDASTPAKKAEYLDMFINKAQAAPIARYGSVFYQNRETNVVNQIEVLESLKQRCEDLSKLNQESMGYSQGMTQVTGQEFDHMINRVAGVFGTAYLIQTYGVFLYTLPFWFWALAVIVTIACVVWFMVEDYYYHF